MLSRVSTRHIALFSLGFIAFATAQSTVDIFQNIYVQNDTVTLQGSDATATTYAYTCNTKYMNEATLAVLYYKTIPVPPLTSGRPSTTLDPYKPDDFAILCPTWTLIQNPTSFSQHLNMPSLPGLSFYSGGIACTWASGKKIREADWTCTVTALRPVAGDSYDSEKSTWRAGDYSEEVLTTTLLREDMKQIGAVGPVTVVGRDGESVASKTSEGRGTARATGEVLMAGGGLVGVVGLGVFF